MPISVRVLGELPENSVIPRAEHQRVRSPLAPGETWLGSHSVAMCFNPLPEMDSLAAPKFGEGRLAGLVDGRSAGPAGDRTPRPRPIRPCN